MRKPTILDRDYFDLTFCSTHTASAATVPTNKIQEPIQDAAEIGLGEVLENRGTGG